MNDRAPTKKILGALVVLTVLVAGLVAWFAHDPSRARHELDRPVQSEARVAHEASRLSETATEPVRASGASGTKAGLTTASPAVTAAEEDDDLPCWLLVFDLDSGAPLEHAKITAELGVDTAITYTDAHGLARVEGLKTQMRLLQLDSFGYSSVFLDTQAGHESAQQAWRVPMSRTATLIVHVRDVMGAIPPESQITLESVGDGPRNRHLTRLDALNQGVMSIASNTDAKGSVTIADLPAGISFQATVFRPRPWSPAERIVLDPGEVREVEWTMYGGCQLHGRLLDQDERPVALHVLWLMPAPVDEAMYFDAKRDESQITVTTDERGRFVVDGLDPGAWWIGPAPRTPDPIGDLRASPHPELEVAPLAQVFRIADAQIAADVTLHVDRGLYISGRVVDPEGAPAIDARVLVSERERGLHAWGRTTDDDGSFAIGPLTQGSYTLLASKVMHDADSEPRSAAAGDADVVLRLRAGAELSGQVIGDDGAATSAKMSLSDRDSSPRQGRGMHADQNGRFVIRGLSPGAFDVIATTDDDRIGWLERVGIAEGATVKGVIVRVTKGGRVRVRHVGSEDVVGFDVLQRGALITSGRAMRNMPAELTVPVGTLVIRALYREGDRRTVDRSVSVAAGQTVEVVFEAGAR